MHDPIIGLDNEGIILFVNDEALKIIGMKSGRCYWEIGFYSSLIQ